MAKSAVQQALEGSPLPEASRPKRGRLTQDDRLRILWGFSRGYPHSRIADALSIHPRTVARYREEIFQYPEVVFALPGVYIQRGKVFACGFCAATRKGETTIRRHVLSHLTLYERARDVPLAPARHHRL